VIFSAPRRLARVSAWREHIPFGMFLISLLRPRVFVELGTHWGNSYCAFCQAVHENGLDVQCYAVDTWEGDEHTGAYGPAVLADLRAHHDPLYGGFSRLIQSTFDDALDSFADGSVDLLHIDGMHAYEAVRHDFEAWLPKLSKHGVVVLHDINARRPGYGVWQFWAELKERYPSFELMHAHGLGILAVGPERPTGLDELLSASPEEAHVVRELFFQLGHRLRVLLLLENRRLKAIELGQRVASLNDALDKQSRTNEGIVRELEEQLSEAQARLAELEEEPQARLEAERPLATTDGTLRRTGRSLLLHLHEGVKLVGRGRDGRTM
jgi:hypothetical protein